MAWISAILRLCRAARIIPDLPLWFASVLPPVLLLALSVEQSPQDAAQGDIKVTSAPCFLQVSTNVSTCFYPLSRWFALRLLSLFFIHGRKLLPLLTRPNYLSMNHLPRTGSETKLESWQSWCPKDIHRDIHRGHRTLRSRFLASSSSFNFVSCSWLVSLFFSACNNRLTGNEMA